MSLVDRFILTRCIDGYTAALHYALDTQETRRFQHIDGAGNVDLEGDSGVFQRIGWVIEGGGMEDALDRMLLRDAQQAAQVQNLPALIDNLVSKRSGEGGQRGCGRDSIKNNNVVASLRQHTRYIRA